MLTIAALTIVLAPVIALVGYWIIAKQDTEQAGWYLLGVCISTLFVLGMTLGTHADGESRKKETACVVKVSEQVNEYLTAEDIERACK